MKIETSKLEGAALDWAVAQVDPQCAGLEWSIPAEGMPMVGYGEIDGTKEPCAYLANSCMLGRKMQMRRDGVMGYAPSTDWAQGGPIMEGSMIALWHAGRHGWASFCQENPKCEYVDTTAGDEITGPTPLIAAMRAIVASEIGDTVDIPEELLS